MRALDVAVGLGAPGADVGVAGAERFDRGAEVALEFVAVVGEDALQAPAGVAQLARDGSCRRCSAQRGRPTRGLRRGSVRL
jgi:hypothetical protein